MRASVLVRQPHLQLRVLQRQRGVDKMLVRAVLTFPLVFRICWRQFVGESVGCLVCCPVNDCLRPELGVEINADRQKVVLGAVDVDNQPHIE